MSTVSSKIPSLPSLPSLRSGGFLKVVGFLAVVISIIFLIQYAIKLTGKLPWPSNIRRIANSQSVEFTQRYSSSLSQKTIDTLWKAVPAEEQLLINTSVVGTRATGYLGPFVDGVFDEEKAVLAALMTGSRLFMIDIDMDKDSRKPVLIYRNSRGYKVSLNNGSIQKLAKFLASNMFRGSTEGTPFNVASSPCIIALIFHKTPDSIKKPAEYSKFLSIVAKELQPLQPNLLTQTPQGDFRRQGLESQIAFQNWEVLKNKCILLANVDTSLQRSPDKYGIYNMNVEDDLDLMVNGRIYRLEEGAGFGVTPLPRQNVSPSFVVFTPNYFLSIPQDKKADTILMTKSKFCIVANSNPELPLKSEQLSSLLTDYGVQCIPFAPFDSKAVSDSFVGSGAVYEKASYVAKVAELRFSPPKKIVLAEPSPKTNALGGKIVAPTL